MEIAKKKQFRKDIEEQIEEVKKRKAAEKEKAEREVEKAREEQNAYERKKINIAEELKK